MVVASMTWLAIGEIFLGSTQLSLNVLLSGSSDGCYGLHIDDALYRGRSQRCATFDNDCLASSEDFTIASMEVWAFTLD